MEPPMTPKPMPASSPNLPTNHIDKLFGIVYITLTGVIVTIIPAAGPFSWLPSCGGHCPQKTRPELPLKTTGHPPKTGSLTKTFMRLMGKTTDYRKATAIIRISEKFAHRLQKTYLKTGTVLLLKKSKWFPVLLVKEHLWPI
ncbi:hypothetical protein DSO57_1024039 [Entomophthora muscae]|uniref:Uncharacterized protein n=1 Tax=Entomophthora muscae TaxID=34485 RepID=A0ACC2UML1_9FUNG|nr:hypothetical protein DSO57_1024039 [Entomophthora muscae]